jgi:hypothetical protein
MVKLMRLKGCGRQSARPRCRQLAPRPQTEEEDRSTNPAFGFVAKV